MTTAIDINTDYTQRREHYMAFNEAAERDGRDWSIVMHERHIEFYSWLGDAIGVTVRDLPCTLDEVRAAIATNKHLNNIKLQRWDRMHSRVSGLARAAGLRSWSLSDTTCVLKNYAVRAIETSEASEGAL